MTMVAVTPVLQLLPAAGAAGGLDSLGLKAGETVTAKVLEVLASGTVRIAVAGQELQVASEALLRPGSEVVLRAERDGQLLKLLVLGGGGEAKPPPTPPVVATSRPTLTPAVTELVRQAHAQLMRGLGDVVQALPPPAARTDPNAAATLERFLQFSASSNIATGPTGAAPVLSPQQRTVLASIANGLGEVAAGATRTLPEVLRQSAARLLGLPMPNNVMSPAAALAQAPPIVSRDAVAALFNSLAAVISQGDGIEAPAIRQAATRLLDLPSPPSNHKPETLSGDSDKASLARAASLFEISARLASSPLQVPPGVRSALEHLLGLRLPLAQITTGNGLQNAVKTSGLLHETLLLQSAPGAPPLPDLKAALLVLRAALQDWIGARTPVSGRAKAFQPPAQGFGSEPVELQSLARNLLNQTQAHLARLRLAQFAATPERIDAGQPARADAPDISGQIPLADGARTALLQFHIEREAAPPEGEDRLAWSVRFSFDLEATGYTHALVVLRGTRIRVRFRTERRETLVLFNANEPLLRALLEEAELDVEDIAAALIAVRPDGEVPQGMLDRLT